jgi:hypothetical protein
MQSTRAKPMHQKETVDNFSKGLFSLFGIKAKTCSAF